MEEKTENLNPAVAKPFFSGAISFAVVLAILMIVTILIIKFTAKPLYGDIKEWYKANILSDVRQSFLLSGEDNEN